MALLSPQEDGLSTRVGGILMGVGARWASGCTSGHDVSGTLQLATSSWLQTICFVGGIATAMLIFRVLEIIRSFLNPL
jgi:uncharacterized membrane protein YedE/YeeE